MGFGYVSMKDESPVGQNNPKIEFRYTECASEMGPATPASSILDNLKNISLGKVLKNIGSYLFDMMGMSVGSQGAEEGNSASHGDISGPSINFLQSMHGISLENKKNNSSLMARMKGFITHVSKVVWGEKAFSGPGPERESIRESLSSIFSENMNQIAGTGKSNLNEK